MITLVLEASTYAGSTALLRDGQLVGERSVAMRGREHEALMPAVASLLEEQGADASQIGRVVCGAGPGSFTSLRIAGGIAKGVALAAGASLVPVSSLALLVASLPTISPGRYLAVIDALRGEHYIAVFDVDETGEIVPAGQESRVPSEEVLPAAKDLGARAVGITQAGESFSNVPHARGAARLADLISRTPAANLSSWEPTYGRLAEAQVKWERAHGQPLTSR